MLRTGDEESLDSVRESFGSPQDDRHAYIKDIVINKNRPYLLFIPNTLSVFSLAHRISSSSEMCMYSARVRTT